jgi:hypothetical protein
MKTVKDLITKLSKPHWMAQDPRIWVADLTPAHIGPLNLTWALVGRPVFTENFFRKNYAIWALSQMVCAEVIAKTAVRDYATLYSEQEFYTLVLKHPDVFARHIPMPRWDKAFKVQA